MSDHRQIEASTGTFDAITAGEPGGRPVLLLHGFPTAATAWAHQVAVLGHAGLRAVAFDQRGYSPSARPPDIADYRLEALVEDVLAVADALGWAEFDLVGHGMGAVVAWHTAAEHPDRLRTITAVANPHPGALAAAERSDEDQAMRSQHLPVLRERSAERRLLADGGAALRQLFEWRVATPDVDDYLERLAEPGALTAALNWFRAERWNTLPDKVDVPALYVWGTEDVTVGSTAALSCGDWVSGAYRFEMAEDVSHWVPQEAADWLTGLLLDHLR
ncbi:alpha/beta hydrolase [Actinokineospora auranticolor]|uniref:Pimeloyl-ACP methyl ester carboxylesterase n=1 Tax=Actinokineospora auranticolor TaxID=155976 RepID=A0A2S6GN79_9PSEU|nr:alpha/beta hydrolase [Actinokineospora auranticolor]PPK66685.1 pimeloyl-ACP methyl ester carboxylesterase [Actinokineospora auranticolor]